jgi:NAD(P)-dependent dehydrogenase (short-subunit alcohol dehydrogenase family)
MSGKRKLVVVFGANGYVGRAIAKEFVKRGTVDLTAISRSGVPPEEKSPSSPSWTEKVDWVAADSTKPDTYAKYLRGVSCVVTSIGVLPFGISEEECFNGNAQTNIIPAKTAQHLHVNRFVAVGASLGFAGALPGVKPYVEGKIAVENFAKNEFVRVGNNNNSESSGNTPGRAPLAVIVKPGGISGTKSLGAGKMNIPLWMLMDPVTFIMKRLGKLGLENSPVRVERVAKAVVNAALSDDEARFLNGGYVEISNEELLTNPKYDF